MKTNGPNIQLVTIPSSEPRVALFLSLCTNLQVFEKGFEHLVTKWALE